MKLPFVRPRSLSDINPQLRFFRFKPSPVALAAQRELRGLFRDRARVVTHAQSFLPVRALADDYDGNPLEPCVRLVWPLTFRG